MAEPVWHIEEGRAAWKARAEAAEADLKRVKAEAGSYWKAHCDYLRERMVEAEAEAARYREALEKIAAPWPNYSEDAIRHFAREALEVTPDG